MDIDKTDRPFETDGHDKRHVCMAVACHAGKRRKRGKWLLPQVKFAKSAFRRPDANRAARGGPQAIVRTVCTHVPNHCTGHSARPRGNAAQTKPLTPQPGAARRAFGTAARPCRANGRASPLPHGFFDAGQGVEFA
jgi:hypothetical protein